MNLLEKAKCIQDWSIKHRRYLHQYPELSLSEKETAAYCAKILSAMGYTIKKSWGHGFIADLNINAKKTIALRADMDALPIQEANQHDFISKKTGVAHMCGHDSHMTIALGAARLLADMKSELKCNVRLIFQPCEEIPPGGAINMIEAGCLAGVDEIYGLHNLPELPVGHVATREGALTASADFFTLTIKGRGGHAARPHVCLDPIVVAAQLINHWQALVARNIEPSHPAILSVCKLHAGEANNVIPNTAEMGGTVRTFDQADRELIINQMKNSLLSYEKAGFDFDFNYIQGYDSIINSAAGVNRVATAAEAIVGEKNVLTNIEPAAFGEDFCYYLQHRPGAFFVLGSGNEKKGIQAPLHSAQFDIDEDALSFGTAIMAQIVLQTTPT